MSTLISSVFLIVSILLLPIGVGRISQFLIRLIEGDGVVSSFVGVTSRPVPTDSLALFYAATLFIGLIVEAAAYRRAFPRAIALSIPFSLLVVVFLTILGVANVFDSSAYSAVVSSFMPVLMVGILFAGLLFLLYFVLVLLWRLFRAVDPGFGRVWFGGAIWLNSTLILVWIQAVSITLSRLK